VFSSWASIERGREKEREGGREGGREGTYLLLELHDDPLCAIFEFSACVLLLSFQRSAEGTVRNALPGVAPIDLQGGREGGRMSE